MSGDYKKYMVVNHGNHRYGVTLFKKASHTDITYNIFALSDVLISTWFKPFCYFVVLYCIIRDKILERGKHNED